MSQYFKQVLMFFGHICKPFKKFVECFEWIFLRCLMDNEQFTHSYRLLVSVLPFMVTFVIGICCLIKKTTFSSLFCWKLYGYSREKLHVNYVWEFKGWTVCCDTLPLIREISWTLAFPTNLFKLQLTKSAEQLKYAIPMPISWFWQVLVNFSFIQTEGKMKLLINLKGNW